MRMKDGKLQAGRYRQAKHFQRIRSANRCYSSQNGRRNIVGMRSTAGDPFSCMAQYTSSSLLRRAQQVICSHHGSRSARRTRSHPTAHRHFLCQPQVKAPVYAKMFEQCHQGYARRILFRVGAEFSVIALYASDRIPHGCWVPCAANRPNPRSQVRTHQIPNPGWQQ